MQRAGNGCSGGQDRTEQAATDRLGETGHLDRRAQATTMSKTSPCSVA
jgi:hypothetical protein